MWGEFFRMSLRLICPSFCFRKATKNICIRNFIFHLLLKRIRRKRQIMNKQIESKVKNEIVSLTLIVGCRKKLKPKWMSKRESSPFTRSLHFLNAFCDVISALSISFPRQRLSQGTKSFFRSTKNRAVINSKRQKIYLLLYKKNAWIIDDEWMFQAHGNRHNFLCLAANSTKWSQNSLFLRFPRVLSVFPRETRMFNEPRQRVSAVVQVVKVFGRLRIRFLKQLDIPLHTVWILKLEQQFHIL